MSNSLKPHELQHARPPCYHQLPELAQIYVHRVGDAIQPSHPLSSACPLPSIFPSIRVFSNELVLCIRLSRFVIAFLPRSKCLLISWLQSLSAVILEHKKIKSLTVSTVSPPICHEMMGPNAISSFFECWVLSQLFQFPLSLSSRGSLVLHFLP